MALGAACSSSGSDGVELSTPWLGSLDNLQRVSGQGNFGIFLKKNEGATAHFGSGFILTPEIIVAAGSDLELVTPETYEKIKDLFAELYLQAMAKEIPAANLDVKQIEPSHLVRAVLTNIKIKNKKTINPTAVSPRDLEFSFGQSRIEAEIRLRRTNERQAVFVLPVTAPTIGWKALRLQFSNFALLTAVETGKARDAINTKADRDPAPTTDPPKKNN
ncbi:MAG: hypothetical protein CMM16_04890 [Rhodospirillaceae bacterium]|nr:hypothetical protein [Rhodospirillaceae bacterium]